ncbi:MraY family glycosyltransferase [Actinocorallia longicatena]|uniref:MraY family glycosyltransferase n=1 Tax=Actinocorallia longicatena TaxID=111803 RepID=A0ABP6QIE5_9ACTN
MREYLLVILTGIATTYLLVSPVKSFAITIGAQSKVRDRDVHTIPTPRVGGLAMFGGVAGALIMASSLPHLRDVFEQTKTAPAVLLAGCLIVLIGVADDLWEIDPLTKFAGQVAAAGVLIMNGVQMYTLPTPFGGSFSLSQAYGIPLTVLLVVATINAVNFIDGLDGLAAGVVGLAALALFVLGYHIADALTYSSLVPPSLIAAILVSVCAGFLLHNFHPARIFMGDTGSMLIGLLIAAATIQMTSQFDPEIGRAYETYPLFLPLVLLPMVVVVPYLDMLLAIWRRTNQGMSPFAPDKHHLHHRLLRLGHSHRQSVLIMYGWVGLMGSCMVAISFVPPNSPNYLRGVVSITIVAAITGALFMVGWPRLRARRAAAAALAASAESDEPRPRLPV